MSKPNSDNLDELDKLINAIDETKSFSNNSRDNLRNKLDSLQQPEMQQNDAFKKLRKRLNKPLTTVDKNYIKTTWKTIFKKKPETKSYIKIIEQQIDDDDEINESNESQNSKSSNIIHVTEYKYHQKWNSDYMEIINKYINLSYNLVIAKYAKKTVMYFFITKLADPSKQNRILCKIGSTNDIVTRMRTLKDELGADIYLINLRTIINDTKEKEFHTMIKQTKPHLYVNNLYIKDKSKTECYIFDESLFTEFDSLSEYDKTINVHINSDEILTMVKHMKINLSQIESKLQNK